MALKITLKPQGPRQHLTSVEDVMNFGKHNGVTVENILHDEPGYFDWLFEKKIITATPEMMEIINNAILNHMDDKSRKSSWENFGSLMHDWEDIPY